MSIKLQKPIADYFAAANAHDIDAMLATFMETAIVNDEKRQWPGRAAIREWIEETISKYRYTVEVTGVAEAKGSVVVTGRVSGTFPGSPIDLRHFFTLAGEKITRLEIRPVTAGVLGRTIFAYSILK